MRLPALALGLTLAGTTAPASVLHFDGFNCHGGSFCHDGGAIDQSYGDLTGLDVQYDADRTTAALDNMVFQKRGFKGMRGAAHSATDSASAISLVADSDHKVVLRRFSLAAFRRTEEATDVTIYDLKDNSILFSTSFDPLDPTGSTLVSGRWRSREGLRIEFGQDRFAGGIDRLRYFVRETGQRPGTRRIVVRAAPPQPAPAPVPLPASGLLLLGGLAAIALGRVRR
jgi:hypothetical protein